VKPDSAAYLSIRLGPDSAGVVLLYRCALIPPLHDQVFDQDFRGKIPCPQRAGPAFQQFGP